MLHAFIEAYESHHLFLLNLRCYTSFWTSKAFISTFTIFPNSLVERRDLTRWRSRRWRDGTGTTARRSLFVPQILALCLSLSYCNISQFWPQRTYISAVLYKLCNIFSLFLTFILNWFFLNVFRVNTITNRLIIVFI